MVLVLFTCIRHLSNSLDREGYWASMVMVTGDIVWYYNLYHKQKPSVTMQNYHSVWALPLQKWAAAFLLPEKDRMQKDRVRCNEKCKSRMTVHLETPSFHMAKTLTTRSLAVGTFPTFHATWWFIIVFTRALYFYPNHLESYLCSIYLKSVSMLPCHLCLGLHSVTFFQVFQLKSFMHFSHIPWPYCPSWLSKLFTRSRRIRMDLTYKTDA